MTTPNAAEEFMRSLDQHPEIEQELRRRLLTQELLDLPNTVGTLASAISEMREIFDRRLTSLESQQSENTEQLNSIQQTLNTLDGRVANITGSDYERTATRRVPSLLSRYLRLSRIQALHSPLQETAPFLVGMINNALTAHDITDSEADDLEQADIIVSANNAAWLAVQVMAHNLARWTARIGLGEQVVTTKTLRRRFFSLTGRLTRSARRLTLHLPQRWPWKNQFSGALAQLRALPFPA